MAMLGQKAEVLPTVCLLDQCGDFRLWKKVTVPTIPRGCGCVGGGRGCDYK